MIKLVKYKKVYSVEEEFSVIRNREKYEDQIVTTKFTIQGSITVSMSKKGKVDIYWNWFNISDLITNVENIAGVTIGVASHSVFSGLVDLFKGCPIIIKDSEVAFDYDLITDTVDELLKNLDKELEGI